MAFTNFYMDGATGSDLNAGTAATGAADYTSTAGNWDGTSVFTPTDGSTPASSIAVGDYVCLYLTGDTFGRLVAQVTVVAAGVNGAVTVSTTIKFGVTPAVQTGTANVKHGGAWASLAPCAANGFLSTGTVPVAMKVNVKAGTYANTTTARTLGLAGAATTPLWVDGYKTSPGDLDNANPSAARVAGTDIPNFTWTSAGLTGATLQTWTNLAINAAFNGNAFAPSNSTLLDRVQVGNTNTGSSAHAVSFGSSGCAAFNCYFKGASTTTSTVSIANNAELLDCYVDGSLVGVTCTTQSPNLIGCVFVNFTGQGLLATTGGPSLDRCTFYGGGGSGVDGVKWSGAPGTSSRVTNSIFDTLTNGVNNASGTNSPVVRTRNNDKHSVTNLYVGFSDVYQPGDVTDASSPFNNAAGGDFTPAAGSGAISGGSPGYFEGTAFSSYLDAGAYQKQPSAGGGGGANLLGNGTLVAA